MNYSKKHLKKITSVMYRGYFNTDVNASDLVWRGMYLYTAKHYCNIKSYSRW